MMTRNEKEAFLVVKSIFDVGISGVVREKESEYSLFKRSLNGATKILDVISNRIGHASALEISRASKMAGYLDGDDHQYILCRTSPGNVETNFECDLHDRSAYPLTLYTHKSAVISSASLGWIQEYRDCIKGRDETVIVNTGMRKYRRSPVHHGHLIERLVPAFKHLCKFNSPFAAACAAKVVGTQNVFQMMDYIAQMDLSSFNKARKVIGVVPKGVTRSLQRTN